MPNFDPPTSFQKHDLIRHSIVASIPACHAGDRGSIPRDGVFFYLFWIFVGCPTNQCLETSKAIQSNAALITITTIMTPFKVKLKIILFLFLRDKYHYHNHYGHKHYAEN